MDRHPELTPTKSALLAVCAYEGTALATGLVPTITNLMWRLNPKPRALILVGVAVWAVDHFFRIPAPRKDP